MSWVADLRYALRSLGRAPLLFAALILSIALGVGANAVVLSFISGLAVMRAPVAAGGRLMLVVSLDSSGRPGPVTFADYQSVASGVHAFASVDAVRESETQVTFEGWSIFASMGSITPGLLDVFGVTPQSGAFVTQRFWKDELGERADLTTRSLSVDGRVWPIAGLVPPELTGLFADRNVDVWMPLDRDAAADEIGRAFWVVGRLRAGTTARDAQAELARLARPAPLAVAPYTGVEPDIASGLASLRILLPVASIVLFLVGCSNVVSLLLSRATRRRHETAVRVALGASRSRLVRLLMAEATVVATAGLTAGVLVAWWTMRAVPALFFEEDAEALHLVPSTTAVIAGLVTMVAMTIGCGLVPLADLRRRELIGALRRKRTMSPEARRWVRGSLVIAQTACCGVLLVSAGVLVHGLGTSLHTPAGGHLETALLATIDTNPALGSEHTRGLFDAARSAAMTATGATSVAWTDVVPGSRPVWHEVHVEPPAGAMTEVRASVGVIPPRAPAVAVWPPVAGRMFGGETVADTCGVVMVNAAANAALFGGRAVGTSIVDATGRRLEVIGVGDVKPATKAPVRTEPTVFYQAGEATPAQDTVVGAFRIPSTMADWPLALLSANIVSPAFFEATGATLVRGELFEPEVAATACRVAVVNDEAEALYFGGRAVGRAILDAGGRRVDIIGVVHIAPLRVTTTRVGPSIFYPASQRPSPRMTMIAKAPRADDEAVRHLKERIAMLDGLRTPPKVRTFEQELARTALAPERIASILVSACAIGAAVLCIIGMYSAASDSVRRRRPDIATRVALGAPRGRLVRAVLGENLRLATAGAAAAGIGSLLVIRLLQPMTGGAGFGAVPWLVAPLLLAVVAVAGAAVPAWRAASVQPQSVMNAE